MMYKGNTWRSFTQSCLPKGFTLIELLVVVLIIGILAAVALPQYNKAVEKSRAAQAFVTLQAAAQAADAYYLEHNELPTSLTQLEIEFPNLKDWTSSIYADEIVVCRYVDEVACFEYLMTSKKLVCASYGLGEKICENFSSQKIDCSEADAGDGLESCYALN